MSNKLFAYLRNLTRAKATSLDFGNRQGAQVFVIILLGLLTSQFFSHSAYATAPYLNFSSSAPTGLVSFSKVQPSSTGKMSTASDTLTVNTNCTVGYNVYVSATSTGSTNLTNDSATSDNIISTSSATMGGTSAVLSANTWGVNGSSSDVAEGKYFGLPTYAEATSNPLVTKSAVDASSTVPIYYGAKVTTSLAPGSYAGDVLYTVLPNTACTYYTVHFDANGSTGSMNNQTITVGQATNLTANTFTRSGYTFLGWSESANGKTGTATNGIGTMADVDYTDAQEVTDIADFNTTKNLYAIWALISGNMQSWTGCPSLAADGIIYLTDTRDNKAYAIKKLADGKCWMMDNLKLVGPKTLITSDSNISTNFSLTANAGDSGWCTENSSACDDQSMVYYDSATRAYYGALYNWYAATAGTGTYAMASGNVTSDICPKGWHLPVGGNNNTTNQFALLDMAINAGDSFAGTNRNTSTTGINLDTQTASFNNMTNIFPLAGRINGSLDLVVRGGYYWSSSVDSNGGAYRLGLSSNSLLLYPRNFGSKYYGLSVRCLAQNSYTIFYSANGGTGSASKTSETAFESSTLTMPTQGSLAKDGYNFLGWALTDNATTVTYTTGQSVSVSDLLAAASAAGQTTTSGSTITLYAVWEQAISGNMQDFNCANITPGTTVRLRDTRDNQVYTVYRWPDTGTAGTSYPTDMTGYCIMTQDLALGYVTGGSVTKGSNLTLTTDSSAGSGTISARTGTSNWSTTNSDSNLQYINGTDATYGTHSYYSYGAAQKVCPKGWRPPTSAEYGNIATFMGGDNSTGSSTIRSAPYNFVYGGSFNSGGWYDVGSYGNYWSSTQYSSTNGYTLRFYSSNLSTTYGSKYFGRSVRCVAAPTMQDFTCSSLAENATVQLTDSRDSNKYYVKKLKDGKCWMVENLKLTNYNLTSTDSNVSSAFDMTSSKIVQSGSSGWCTNSNTTCYQKISVYARNDSNGNLYNWYTATAGTSGSSYSICPKGWRLPTGGSGGEFAALDIALGGTGSNRTNANTYSTFTGAYTSGNNAGFTPLPGCIYGSLDGVGSDGFWWSSTASGSDYAYRLYLGSGDSRVYPQDYVDRYGGYSVRCVASS